MVGEICNQRVEFLVDSGASNNFLSFHDATKLGLIIKDCRRSSVRLADGKKLVSS